MPFFGIFDDDQLSMMTAALAEYCEARGIRPGTPDHHDAATLMMSLFRNGLISVNGVGAAFTDGTDDVGIGREDRQAHG